LWSKLADGAAAIRREPNEHQAAKRPQNFGVTANIGEHSVLSPRARARALT
jgi:hypothetical protein